ncbi:MAG: hypothetical protein JW974_02710 [Alphaproteobacteria bacterium]|nr:hypothetical protein [Alphaproteobacteria bacterium]MBN2675563.1 hypothetical protein [Alphaproteobacteria bacterium]
MKSFLVTFILMLFLLINKSYGAACMSCVPEGGGLAYVYGCLTAIWVCDGGGTSYETCNTCQSGFTKTLISGLGCSNVYNCIENCTGCTNCTDIGWTAYNAGYERYTDKTCVCNTCNITYSYRCSAGYYGTSNSIGTSGCIVCPANATCPGGNASTFFCISGYYKNGTVCTICPSGGSSLPGSTSITSCNISSGDDESGIFEYDPNCYYSL